MKKILLPTLCLLISVLLIAVMPTDAEAAIYDDTIRLHILAPSDSAEHQALKFKIRDRMLEKYSDILSCTKNIDEAKSTVLSVAEDIKRDCEEWISEEGYNMSVSVELVEEWYETREYGDIALPAGEYTSLKITLGEGEGQNWWCVMYPPLCLDAALGEETSYTDAEKSLISKSGYRVKFKLLEVVSTVFSR